MAHPSYNVRVVEYLKLHSRGVTAREISIHLKTANTRHAGYVLATLYRKGYLVRETIKGGTIFVYYHKAEVTT